MRLYIIAGEASGDLHASNLVKSIKQQQDAVEFRGLGGDLMEQQGVTLLKHYRETAFMGFWEVIRNLQKILGYIELCKKDILDWKPDAQTKRTFVKYLAWNVLRSLESKRSRLR